MEKAHEVTPLYPLSEKPPEYKIRGLFLSSKKWVILPDFTGKSVAKKPRSGTCVLFSTHLK
jgi:hypothetical protein